MSPNGAIPPEGGGGEDRALARRHRPLLRLDAAEPYRPQVMGYTVFRAPGPSPSSRFTIEPRGTACIEYAIWYDWDIQHLYDLEHVWVHVDGSGNVVAVEASFHGARVPMTLAGNLPALACTRPVLYAEPGKHAHWADGAAMAVMAGEKIRAMCGSQAGADAVHRGNPFAEAGLITASALEDRLATRKMQRDAFVPRFAFTRTADDSPPALCSWETLEAWIPARVAHLCAALPRDVPHLAAVLLDCGDTLIDEATEVKAAGSELVLEAEEIPHAMDAVRRLAAAGYRLALVADGPRLSFENLLKPRGIWELFDAHVISEDVGELKPSPKMFATALDRLGLGDIERNRVVMVGNNLARDIAGANSFGLTSLYVGWSKQRPDAPADPLEMPDARIDRLDRLPETIDAFELAL